MNYLPRHYHQDTRTKTCKVFPQTTVTQLYVRLKILSVGLFIVSCLRLIDVFIIHTIQKIRSVRTSFFFKNNTMWSMCRLRTATSTTKTRLYLPCLGSCWRYFCIQVFRFPWYLFIVHRFLLFASVKQIVFFKARSRKASKQRSQSSTPIFSEAKNQVQSVRPVYSIRCVPFGPVV